MLRNTDDSGTLGTQSQVARGTRPVTIRGPGGHLFLPEQLPELRRKIRAQAALDARVLDDLVRQARDLAPLVRPIRPQAAPAVALNAADVGNDSVAFQPVPAPGDPDHGLPGQGRRRAGEVRLTLPPPVAIDVGAGDRLAV